MTETPTTEATAESLLQKLQAVLCSAAGGEPGTRAALRATERAHGAQATRYGRLLNDLVADSHAWDLWEGPPTRGARLPRLHELSVLLEDYFAWRGTDPRKRSRELRQQIAARMELLCSDRMPIRSETELWLTDPATGRRRKTLVTAEGPLLVKRSRFFRPQAAPGDSDPETAGYLLSLGEWARPFVQERAMLGVHLKRLAEYDLQRQGWERRIGWYLVFQMNNQGSRMTFQDVIKDGKTRTLVTPQHPLKMKTILSGSHVAWEEMAQTNPGKVIKQWGDALETLRRDGILGPCPCLDGAADGSDLPARGRLAAMLERRFQFVPGRDLLPHLRAKRGAAERQRAG